MDFFRTLEEDDPQHGTERRERRRERAFYEYMTDYDVAAASN